MGVEGGLGGGTLVGFCDVAEEDGPDDTTSTPHECDARVIEFPAIVVCGGTHKHESLGIGDKFRRIQCLQLTHAQRVGAEGYLFKFIDEGFLVTGKFGVWAGE